MGVLAVEEYPALVKKLIAEYAAFVPSYGEIEVETIFDDERQHYELMYAGWRGPNRVHGSVIHIDIRGDKIWVQHDGTEAGITNELLAAGVPRSQIVLGFHSPTQRKYTDFALG